MTFNLGIPFHERDNDDTRGPAYGDARGSRPPRPLGASRHFSPSHQVPAGTRGLLGGAWKPRTALRQRAALHIQRRLVLQYTFVAMQPAGVHLCRPNVRPVRIVRHVTTSACTDVRGSRCFCA